MLSSLIHLSNVCLTGFVSSSLGEYMVMPCDKKQQTVCHPCKEGYFSSDFNNFDRCVKCQTCQQGKKTLNGLISTENVLTKHMQAMLAKRPNVAGNAVVWLLVYLQNILKTAREPQMQSVHVALVSCVPTISVQLVRKTNALHGRRWWGRVRVERVIIAPRRSETTSSCAYCSSVVVVDISWHNWHVNGNKRGLY